MTCEMLDVFPDEDGNPVQVNCTGLAVCRVDGIPACAKCRAALVAEEGEDFYEITDLEGGAA